MSMNAFDHNTLLGGRVLLKQPQQGFKASSDAVFLAASIPAKSGDRVLDVGCGIGTATLCLLARVPGTHVVGLEVHRESYDYARENAVLNHWDDRFDPRLGDIFAPDACGENFDHVLSNPPYYHPSNHTAPTDGGKSQAHMETTGDLESWVRYCCRRTKSRGTVTFVFTTTRLHELMALMGAYGVGSLRLYPLWSKAGIPAKRFLLQGIKGGKAPFVLCPGLIVHEQDGSHTPEAAAILRGGAGVSLQAGTHGWKGNDFAD